MQLKHSFDGRTGPESVILPQKDPNESRSVEANSVWSLEEWGSLHSEIAEKIVHQTFEPEARSVAAKWGRKVLRSYSSSFYAVTRFLPSAKRADVEMVYSAVRYPDEVVDTFLVDTDAKVALLEEWQDQFERSASYSSIIDSVSHGVSPTVAGFRDVANRHGIPDDYYLSFLEAMRSDIEPQLFADWPDLIDRYIYGSATVVGYFLAYIYRPAAGASMDECMESARSLAIALQLTNFARDVADDSVRCRCYLPVDRKDDSGNRIAAGVLAGESNSMMNAVLQLAEQAAAWYDRAEPGISSFSPDSRIAIEACHRLYARLNNKILLSESANQRSSLSVFEKLSTLPKSKYWRLPAALIFER